MSLFFIIFFGGFDACRCPSHVGAGSFDGGSGAADRSAAQQDRPTPAPDGAHPIHCEDGPTWLGNVASFFGPRIPLPSK